MSFVYLRKRVIGRAFESLLDLVKEYVLDVWEERKSRLYGKNACAQQPSPQSPTGDLGDIAGVKVRNGAREVSLAQISCIMMYSSSAHSSGCMVDGLSAMAAY